MSDVADRLRALANLATNGLEDTTDVIVRAASMAVAREDLGEIALELARGYADALDALARFNYCQIGGMMEGHPDCCAGCKAGHLLAEAARLFPEDEA